MIHPDYNIGDIVTFKKKKSFFNITGEIKGIVILNGKTYLKIYSFYNRKEEIYILTKHSELILIKKMVEPLDYEKRNEVNDNKFSYEILNKFAVKIFAVLIIISLVIPYTPKFVTNLFVPRLSYTDFISKNISIYEVYKIITDRMAYRYDRDEFWETPKTAWVKKFGDCEEFASICSDYLTKHKIENYLVGLNIKNSNIGHAVVFAKINNFYYMLDLTRAVELDGIKRLDKTKDLREAVLKYSTLPVTIYKIPDKDGKKEVLSYIY